MHLSNSRSLLIAATLLVVLVWWLRPMPPSSLVDANRSPAAISSAEAALAKRRAPPPAQAQAEHSHTVPAALDFTSDADFRQQDHWFDAMPAQPFAPNQTRIEKHPHCARQAKLVAETLETNVQRELGIDLSQAVPDTILLEEIAQFWQLDGRFYQIGARWQKDQPATYALDHFVAADAAMTQDLQKLPLPLMAPSSFDVITVGEYLSAVLADVQARGGQIGARLVHAQPGDGDGGGDDTHDLKLNNGRIVSWSFGDGRCQRRKQGDAYCQCVDPAAEHAEHDHDHPETHPSDKEPYRVID